jgi:hypothetical protein
MIRRESSPDEVQRSFGMRTKVVLALDGPGAAWDHLAAVERLARSLSMQEPRPTRDDRFSFGLWTVGWPARDPFGDATRPPPDPVETDLLADRGSFEDFDVAAAGRRGMHYAALDQPAVEHLLGARS